MFDPLSTIVITKGNQKWVTSISIHFQNQTFVPLLFSYSRFFLKCAKFIDLIYIMMLVCGLTTELRNFHFQSEVYILPQSPELNIFISICKFFHFLGSILAWKNRNLNFSQIKLVGKGMISTVSASNWKSRAESAWIGATEIYPTLHPRIQVLIMCCKWLSLCFHNCEYVNSQKLQGQKSWVMIFGVKFIFLIHT